MSLIFLHVITHDRVPRANETKPWPLWIAGPVKGSGDQFHQVRELVLPIG